MTGNLKVSKSKGFLSGEITIPPDKSISHRSLILGAIASNNSKEKITIKNLSKGTDCISTLKILEKTGVKFEFLSEHDLILDAKEAFKNPSCPLDCGNSGTGARLLSGLFASIDGLKCTLFGDESLSKRPMKRIIVPLELMGAKIESNEGKMPLKIEGRSLEGIIYRTPVASAQIKSALLIAGLSAKGKTKIVESALSRNHTEIMLNYLEAKIATGKDETGFWTEIEKSDLKAKPLFVPGDISSAAFFMVAAAIIPNSRVLIKDVGINPTRTGILDIFKDAGVNFALKNEREISGEKVADIEVLYTEKIKPFTIQGDIIPGLIDEIPILAVLAAHAEGKSEVKDAQDLRNKESDRIKSIVEAFLALGIKIEEKPDGFVLCGDNKTTKKENIFLKTHLDHRLAMSYYILSLAGEKETEIEDFSCVDTSFPEFLELIEKLRKEA